MAPKNDIIRGGSNGRRSTFVVHGGLVYISGITSVDIEGDMAAQATDVFSQIDKLLLMNDSDKHRVLLANVTIASMDDYGDFNAAWDAWVDDGFEPARNLTQGGLALPQYRLKISLVAAQA